MIIDATNLILGRLASYAAVKLMRGESVVIINCEKTAITGNKKEILLHYRKKLELGQPHQGPYLQRRPDLFVRRVVKGMLPKKRARGKDVAKKLKCHLGVPEQYAKEKLQAVKGAEVEKLPNLKYMKVGELCRLIGASQ